MSPHTKGAEHLTVDAGPPPAGTDERGAGTAPRVRLRALAEAAGYPGAALMLIAEAALPHYLPGDRLDDLALQELCSAVEVLAQAGHSATTLERTIQTHRQRHGPADWRGPFWSAQLAAAAKRFNHPETYGLSPCETDPARLARYGRIDASRATGGIA